MYESSCSCWWLFCDQDSGDVAALVRSHINALYPFESTTEQTTETMPPSHETITDATMTTNRNTSLQELLYYRILSVSVLILYVAADWLSLVFHTLRNGWAGKGSGDHWKQLNFYISTVKVPWFPYVGSTTLVKTSWDSYEN